MSPREKRGTPVSCLVGKSYCWVGNKWVWRIFFLGGGGWKNKTRTKPTNQYNESFEMSYTINTSFWTTDHWLGFCSWHESHTICGQQQGMFHPNRYSHHLGVTPKLSSVSSRNQQIAPEQAPNSMFDFKEHLQHTKIATSLSGSLSMLLVPKHLPP